MITLVDNMLIVNLDALSITAKANLPHLGLFALLLVLYFSPRRKK